VVAFEESNHVPDFLRTFGPFRPTMPRHRPIWGTRPARIDPGLLEDSLVFVSFACAPAVIVIGSCRAYSVAEGRVTIRCEPYSQHLLSFACRERRL